MGRRDPIRRAWRYYWGVMRILLMLSLAGLAWGQATVKSPDGGVVMSISTDNGKLVYTVAFQGKPVIAKSALALEIQDQALLGDNVRIAGSRPGAVDETYTMPHGKANPIRDVCKT